MVFKPPGLPEAAAPPAAASPEPGGSFYSGPVGGIPGVPLSPPPPPPVAEERSYGSLAQRGGHGGASLNADPKAIGHFVHEAVQADHTEELAGDSLPLGSPKLGSPKLPPLLEQDRETERQEEPAEASVPPLDLAQAARKKLVRPKSAGHAGRVARAAITLDAGTISLLSSRGSPHSGRSAASAARPPAGDAPRHINSSRSIASSSSSSSSRPSSAARSSRSMRQDLVMPQSLDGEFKSQSVPVEITVEADGLPLLQNTQSCMSVFAVLWIYHKEHQRWQEHGRTEVVRSGADPQFTRAFHLDYFEHNDALRNEENDDHVRVELYQHSSSAVPHLDRRKVFGQVVTTLRELHRTPIKRVSLRMQGQAEREGGGHITLRISDVAPADLQPMCHFKVSARSMRALLPKDSRVTRPFLRVLRYTRGGEYELFHRSETARAGFTISFAEFTTSFHRCCFGDPETYLRLEVWNEEKFGQHYLIGGTETSVGVLLGLKADTRKAGLPLGPAPGAASLVMTSPVAASAPITGKSWPAHTACLVVTCDKFGGSSQTGRPGSAASSAPLSSARGGEQSSGRGQRAPAPVGRSASSTVFDSDLKFLNELLGEQMVQDSDVKDIVGDGIRFLSKRTKANQKASKPPAGRGGSGGGLSTPSKKSRRAKTASPGMGYFLDEDAVWAVDGGRRLGTRRQLDAIPQTKASRGHGRLRPVASTGSSAGSGSAAGVRSGSSPGQRRRPEVELTQRPVSLTEASRRPPRGQPGRHQHPNRPAGAATPPGSPTAAVLEDRAVRAAEADMAAAKDARAEAKRGGRPPRLSARGHISAVRHQARADSQHVHGRAMGDPWDNLPRPCRRPPLAEQQPNSPHRNRGKNSRQGGRQGGKLQREPESVAAAQAEFAKLETLRGRLEAAETQADVSRLVGELAELGITFDVSG